MKKKDQNIYKEELKQYIKNVKESKIRIKASEVRLELQFESLKDWSQVHNFKYIKSWFNEKRKKTKIKVKNIPMNECKGWKYNEKKG